MFNKIKSPETLFNSTIPTDAMLVIMNKNILYLTHTVDKCLSLLKKIENDDKLQTQVNQYFEDDQKDIPEEDKEPD